MNGWMDDRGVGRWMDKWIDGIYRRANACMDEQKDGGMHGWIDGWVKQFFFKRTHQKLCSVRGFKGGSPLLAKQGIQARGQYPD